MTVKKKKCLKLSPEAGEQNVRAIITVSERSFWGNQGGGKTNGRQEKELNRNMNGRNKLKSVPGNAHDAKPRLHDDGRNGI